MVFDNDGVIMGSNNLKTEAFKKALEYEDVLLVDEFIRYHKTFGGVSRFEKFQHFYINIKKEKNYKVKLEEALDKYSSNALKALMNADLIPGIENFLELLKSNNKITHVVSGSDQKELLGVYKARNLIPYFNYVSGSPETKNNILKEMIQDSKISFPAVYFGDSKLDYIAAKKHGFDFVFISSKSEWNDGESFCKKMNCLVEPNFIDANFELN